MRTIPVLKSTNLRWSSLVSARCAKYKKSGHMSLDCAKGGKISSGSSLHKVLSDTDKNRLAVIYAKHSAPSFLPVANEINDRFAALKNSLASLAEHVDMLAKRLKTPEPINQGVNIVMSESSDVVTGGETVTRAVIFNSSVIGKIENTLKNFVIMVMGLSAKINNAGLFATCNVRSLNVSAKQEDIVHWHKKSENMFESVHVFTSGLDKSFFGIGVVVIMNNFLACHMSKIKEVPGQIISIWLLFKGKLSVMVLDQIRQALEVNSVIAEAVNSSTFVVLDGNFNKNRSKRSVTFKFCLNLGLVNSFTSHYIVKAPTWNNSQGVCFVSGFFDTDHNAVLVSIGLDGLLEVQLNSLCKQANKDQWKFKIKDANSPKWTEFRDCLSAKLLAVVDEFFGAETHSDVDAMWAVLKRIIVESADETFSSHWFSEFYCSKDKFFSKFFGLELLIAKIVKKFGSGDLLKVNCLVRTWSTLDSIRAHAFADLVGLGEKSEVVLGYLLLVHKEYRRSKMYESKLAKETFIRLAISKHMENFCSDKVVLDYLMVNDDLILEPEEVKLNVDRIIEDWTRKQTVPLVVPDLWAHQYALLNYVQDCVFSNMMSAISLSELILVVNGLSDGKAAGLSMLEYLLRLLNACLLISSVLVLWRRAWPIALIKTARKILSKILSDRISFAYSKFGVLCGDNFFILKNTSIQSPVFAVGLVVKNALEKDCELWLIKMCDRFIRFFSGIHGNRINRVMTNFGLTNGYRICDGLDQDEFVARTGRIEAGGRLSSFFAASAFYALNIASEFFTINNISINNKKTVAISINQDVKMASLSISGQPISIARKSEIYRYLSIFLSIKELFKLSVTKAHSNMHFFVNVVLKKIIADKQFSYLVLAVLQSIVSYRTQFGFVLLGVCCKWDALVWKGLRSKAHLPHDFLVNVLYYSLLYGLKFFEQLQSECKSAAVVLFSNASGIFGCLFNHRFLDLQILGWTPLNLLQFFVKLCVSSVNNFLAGVVKIFLDNGLSLANNLSSAFYSSGVFPISSVLGNTLYFGSVCSLKHFGITFGNRLFDKKSRVMDWKTFYYWKKLDLKGLVPFWFVTVTKFLLDIDSFLVVPAKSGLPPELDVLNSMEFSDIQSGLHEIWSGLFDVYTNGLLRDARTANIADSMTAYFLSVNMSVGVKVVTLVLECIPSSCIVVLYLNSQTVIDMCISKMSLAMLDFCVKIKSHSEVMDNMEADAAAGYTTCFKFSLPVRVCKNFLIAENMTIFGNAHHFVRNMFWFICHAYWKAGPGQDVVLSDLIGCVD
ncbi:hypothetical protein G9A89_018864 [Geosiphon pyriformis]|nr:hypothetical protein G9A89_018864 [Geosiphon pyriformis]